MTAIRILELGQDAELSRLARGGLDGNLKTSSQADSVVVEKQFDSETGVLSGAESADLSADVVLVLCPDAETATSLAKLIEGRPGNTPWVFFTTTQVKLALLQMPETVAWDVVSVDEVKRLRLSAMNAAELAEARRREARLQEEFGQAKNLLLKNQKS